MTSNLQKQQRTTLQVVPKDINFGSGRLIEILKNAVSVEHLRELPTTDKKKLYAEWHHIYILMARAAGAMSFIAEGHKHEIREQRQIGIASRCVIFIEHLLPGRCGSLAMGREPWRHGPLHA